MAPPPHRYHNPSEWSTTSTDSCATHAYSCASRVIAATTTSCPACRFAKQSPRTASIKSPTRCTSALGTAPCSSRALVGRRVSAGWRHRTSGAAYSPRPLTRCLAASPLASRYDRLHQSNPTVFGVPTSLNSSSVQVIPPPQQRVTCDPSHMCLSIHRINADWVQCMYC